MKPCSSVCRTARLALGIGLAAIRKLLRQPVGLRPVEFQRRHWGVVPPQQHDAASPVRPELELEAGGERRSGRCDEWIVALHCPSPSARPAPSSSETEPRDA